MNTTLSKTAVNFNNRYCEQNYDKSISYDIYKRDTKNCETLDKDNEYMAFIQLRNGNEKERNNAFDRIIKANQPLVQLCARKFAPKDMIMDYINEANIALINAVNTFNLELGNTFCTYATKCIVNHYNRYCSSLCGLVNIKTCGGDTTKLHKIINNFVQENERYPETFEIEEMISAKELPRLNKNNIYTPNYLSLDGGTEDYEKYSIYSEIEKIYNNHNETEDKIYMDREDIEFKTNIIIGKLDEKILNASTQNIKNSYERKRDIIIKYFGLYGQDKQNIKEIAEDYGITTTRVQQIISKTIATLKKELKHSL